MQKTSTNLQNDSSVLYYLGMSYSNLGEYSDAALFFRKALKIDPNNPSIHFALGKSYFYLNKNKKVQETLDILNMLDRNLYDNLQALTKKKYY